MFARQERNDPGPQCLRLARGLDTRVSEPDGQTDGDSCRRTLPGNLSAGKGPFAGRRVFRVMEETGLFHHPVSPVLFEVNHRPESRMREIRPSGSEGGEPQSNAASLPLFWLG